MARSHYRGGSTIIFVGKEGTRFACPDDVEAVAPPRAGDVDAVARLRAFRAGVGGRPRGKRSTPVMGWAKQFLHCAIDAELRGTALSMPKKAPEALRTEMQEAGGPAAWAKLQPSYPMLRAKKEAKLHRALSVPPLLPLAPSKQPQRPAKSKSAPGIDQPLELRRLKPTAILALKRRGWVIVGTRLVPPRKSKLRSHRSGKGGQPPRSGERAQATHQSVPKPPKEMKIKAVRVPASYYASDPVEGPRKIDWNSAVDGGFG